jgi:hypothetical protein
VVIIASVGKAGEGQKEQIVCGICRFALSGPGECPRCRLAYERTAKGLRARQRREALFREIGKIVEDGWEEADESDTFPQGRQVYFRSWQQMVACCAK